MSTWGANGRIQVEVIQDDDGIHITGPNGELISVECQWFARCENPATLTEPHPILGDVPLCQRCADKLEKLKA